MTKMVMKIYAWADSTWHYADEIPDIDMFLQCNGLSDDYRVMNISTIHDHEGISKIVENTMNGRI